MTRPYLKNDNLPCTKPPQVENQRESILEELAWRGLPPRGGAGFFPTPLAHQRRVSQSSTQTDAKPKQNPPNPPNSVDWTTCTLANVTSLFRNLEATLALGGDIMGLTESRLGEASQRSMRRIIRRKGWPAFWGAPCPILRKKNNKNDPLILGTAE